MKKRKLTVASRRFASFYINKDFTSDISFIKRCLHWSAVLSTVKYDCVQVMKAVDKNGDGEISKEEFVTHAFESDVIRNIL